MDIAPNVVWRQGHFDVVNHAVHALEAVGTEVRIVAAKNSWVIVAFCRAGAAIFHVTRRSPTAHQLRGNVPAGVIHQVPYRAGAQSRVYDLLAI